VLCEQSQAIPRLMEVLTRSHRRVFTLEMFMIYANSLVSFLQEVQALENEIARQRFPFNVQQQQAHASRLVGIIVNAYPYTETLGFTHSARQLQRLRERIQLSPVSGQELVAMLSELRRRVEEDLQDRVFWCINDPVRIHRFFKRSTEEPNVGFLVFKSSDEVFDPKILDRFPEIEDDLIEATTSFIFHRFTGCVFHLMRIVERGVLEVAKLGEITDPKPSWGAILSRLDKYAYRTDFKDLPASVQPNIATIKTLLPTLHAIQHAWRNKITHVENRLIPVGKIGEEETLEIMNAVQAFMRTLATELGPVTAP
jgi:hypothetical protein